MKTFVTAAGLAVGVSAGILPRNDGCCFQLSASGDVSGTVGQLDDGQNRVGGGYGEATYCIKDGKITDKSGRGCILTGPTTQFQCDMGASPDGGFSVHDDGSLQHDGDSAFWACPADEGEYNLYTEKLDNMPKCVEVSLSTNGKCGGGAQTMSSPAAPGTTSKAGNTCPPQQTVTKTEQGKPSTVYKTETQYKPTTVHDTKTEYKPTTIYETKTEQNTKVQPTTVYSTKTVEETETATKPTTVYETKTQQETVSAKPTTVYETKTQTQQETVSAKPTTVYKTKTIEETETATKPTTVYQTQTQQETVTAKQPTTIYKTKTVEETETATKPTTIYQTKTIQQTETAKQPTTIYQTKTVEETETAKKPVTQYVTKTEEGKPSTITQYKTKYETQQAPAQTVTKSEKYCPQTEGGGKPTYGGGKPTETKPAPTSEASACPTDLSGNYEYPHLIVPVSSDSPDKAYGTSYNGKMDMTTSSIFNFDIPQSYEGQTCSLVFLFPEKSDLETSDFTFNGKGSIGVEHLSSPAKQSTSWNSAPDVDSHLGDISPQPGNSYVIHTGDCAAGTTQSYELSAADGLSLEYFQDYNPSPIGLYITTC